MVELFDILIDNNGLFFYWIQKIYFRGNRSGILANFPLLCLDLHLFYAAAAIFIF